MSGTGAAVRDGVLTLTRADHTKASYEMMRPKVAQGAPGTTGARISMEAIGNGIMFTVNADNSITGRELPAQLTQVLTQGAQR